MIKLLTNCPNCGSPLSADGYCSYCDTKVRYANEIEANLMTYGHILSMLPLEILFKFKAEDGTLVLLPFNGRINSIDINYDSIMTLDNSGITITKKVSSSPEISLELSGTVALME